MTFEMDVAELARRAWRNNRLDDVRSILERIEDYGPAWCCLKYGHPQQPKRWLSRFKNRPWRCSRCASWWVAKQTTTVRGETFWAWTYVGDEVEERPDE